MIVPKTIPRTVPNPPVKITPPITAAAIASSSFNVPFAVSAVLTSNTCVESTARYAVEMGYHTTLLTDAVATFSLPVGAKATLVIASV